MDPHLIKAVIKTESNFDPQAVSRAGAKGLMQLMPATARELGVKDPFNPVENIWAGARYLKKILDRHSGNINNALASYNWGPGNFDRHGGMRLPGETKRYITAVNKHYAKLKQNGAVQA
jgi:soluble lytic murein transglycosylase-like protein